MSDECCPATLYHYTTAASIHSIFTTKSLWATSIQFMNDASELLLALDRAVEGLRRRAESCEDPYVSERLQRMSNTLSPELLADDPDMRAPVTVCAVSLSAQGDLLSQWRAYGGSQPAYAIGLRTDALKRMLQGTDWRLERCRYSQQEHEAVIDRLVDWISTVDVNLCAQSWGQFLEWATVIKHEGFREEEEWRIVSGKRILSSLEFRSTPSLLLPYAELRLGSSLVDFYDLTAGGRVGPHPHQQLARAAMAAYLERVFDTPKPVDGSQTPHRQLQ
jgi:hypothetical protein